MGILFYEDINGFSPGVVSGLTAWYDASTTAVGSVSTWADKSGNGYDATQGTGSAQPTCTANQLNSKNVLVFDGGDSLTIPAGIASLALGDSTVFAVANSSIDNTVQRIVRLPNTVAGAVGLSFFSTSNEMVWVHGATNLGLIGVVKANFNIFMGRRNGATQAISLDNGTEVTDANGANVTVDGISAIGSTQGTTQFLTGNIAELIIYNRSLSSAEITKVYTYLSQKWNVSISLPLALSPLLWLDGNDPAGTGTPPADGSSVATWVNKTGNSSYNFSNATGAQQAVFNPNKQNGLGALSFTTATQMVNISGALAPLFSTTMSAAIVIRTTTSNDFLPMTATVDVLGNRFNFLVPLSANQNVYCDFGDALGAGRLQTNPGSVYAATYNYIFVVDPTATNKMTQYRSGVSIGTSLNSGTFNGTGKFMNIGFLSSTGYLCEVLLFNYALSSNQVTALNTYLSNKWGT